MSALKHARVTKEVVLAKCDYFVEVQLWPLKSQTDPAAWLSNFLPAEQQHALHLLHAFQYYSEHLTDELFQAAFQGLSLVVCDPADSYVIAQTKWRTFLGQTIVTYVEGETSNPTDSGFSFARRARQLIGVDESQIKYLADALSTLLTARGTPPPIIFVDDFVGSGDQFVETWTRMRDLEALKVKTSFKEAASLGAGSFFYCPLVSTAKGEARVRLECPEVFFQPVHILTDRDSALAPDSHIWPDALQSTSQGFLETASIRAGITNWKGYADLGLTLAFKHSVPDATLPLFYWRQNGWKPLVKRA